MCLGKAAATNLAAPSKGEQVEGSTPLVDVGQSVDRLRIRPIMADKPTKLLTITPNMKLIIYVIRPEAPVVTGLGALLVHGWPLEMAESILQRAPFSHSLLLDLAGNSFVGVAFGTVLMSLLAVLQPEMFSPSDDGAPEGICDLVASLVNF